MFISVEFSLIIMILSVFHSLIFSVALNTLYNTRDLHTE